ncbi:hypothetical protein CWI36_0928p0030 [Hamiltosporidium magnivora]|uniref:Uncharacterized protein n=1 Tax=Hamiltosporidium magnivora TaxID=148818 RepID=A0A4Q9L8Z0_9MICR|nr:hypothetical protein CWI36_0928p0030 [Hamiltosporidium magnivora]
MEDHTIKKRKRWIKHFYNIFYTYNRSVDSATNKSLFILFFGQPNLNTPLSGSIIVEKKARTKVSGIDIDIDIVLVEENAAKTQWIL